ncbi:MAG: hypothetical protein OXI27_09680, partial [Thaumarchaeota archaeon]|nr:hypothetical protein [Nitrososphaerota archaeon]
KKFHVNGKNLGTRLTLTKQVIGQRNSRLQLKSDRGAESLCIMLSCTETWKLRKLNVWEELRRAIGPSAASDI